LHLKSLDLPNGNVSTRLRVECSQAKAADCVSVGSSDEAIVGEKESAGTEDYLVCAVFDRTHTADVCALWGLQDHVRY
jgi:hypothetical protein